MTLYVIAGIYWLSETAYFGWNWSPQSSAEVVADGIAMILLALAIGFGKC